MCPIRGKALWLLGKYYWATEVLAIGVTSVTRGRGSEPRELVDARRQFCTTGSFASQLNIQAYPQINREDESYWQVQMNRKMVLTLSAIPRVVILLVSEPQSHVLRVDLSLFLRH